MGTDPTETMKEGRPLAINHMIFHSLIGDPRFYDQVPAFYFLKEQGLAVHRAIVQAVVDGKTTCRSCSNVKDMVQPLFAAFTRHAVMLSQDSPEALNALVGYISRKKGYRPKPIVMYHKQQGVIHQLEL